MTNRKEGQERPSTSSGRTGGGDPPSREASAGEAGERLVPGKNRNVQIARTGSRKLFDRTRRKVFLEWFAATANVKMSAEKAGVNYKTVFKHRMKDADFAADWNRALAQGYARVEAKVLETRGPGGGGGPIAIDGDLDAPELDEVDPQAVQLLREHRRGLAEGKGAGQSRKQGRRPRVASNAEVKVALMKALVAFEARVKARSALPVIASEARQSSAEPGLSDSEAGLLRSARNDEHEEEAPPPSCGRSSDGSIVPPAQSRIAGGNPPRHSPGKPGEDLER